MMWSMQPDEIIAGLKRLGVTHARIAEAAKIDRTAATKMMGGGRRMQPKEIAILAALLAEAENEAGESSHIQRGVALIRDQDAGLVSDYVSVEILPTYAGMGGGGTGEGEQKMALLPRQLIEDDLRGRPEDFLVLDCRGVSMLPDFLHGDRIVIDKRDRNPVQPGPFALWDGDGYVFKNVERRKGRYRVFPSNKEYSEAEYDPEEIQIMGRPVWYARRL